MIKEIRPEIAQNLMEFGEKPVVPMTLIYLLKGDEVLLMRRKSDKEMVPGKVLGLGGKVEPGESLLDSAIREVREEAGVEVENLQLRGAMGWLSDKNRVSQIFIFVGVVEDGTEVEREQSEGELFWAKRDEILDLPDLADHQRIFLPIVLEGNDFYSGMAGYWEGELLIYCDNQGYFDGRRHG